MTALPRLRPENLPGAGLIANVRDAWSRARPRTQTTIKLALLAASIIGAYYYSLVTLFQTLGLETPLAFLSLVPVIAIVLAVVRANPRRPEPAIHDRQTDYIIGLPLIALALGINLLLPRKFSVMFWVWRLDLLSLPFFVAGAVAVLFGVRVLWRQKLAVSFLLLAWPLPYSAVLLSVLNLFTDATLAGLRLFVRFVHIATYVPSSGNALFSITHHGQSFPVSVVSACSGVNGVVGFVLVGSAFGAVVQGPRLRKFAWLFVGAVITWGSNLARLVLLFWAGQEWGEKVAIDVLHPFVGLLTFAIGVLVMLLTMRWFGVSIDVEPARPKPVVQKSSSRSVKRAAPKIFAAAFVVVAASLILALNNSGMRVYNLVADAAGEPTLASFQSEGIAPAGWSRSQIATYTWAEPLFGDGSSWQRYEFADRSFTAGNLSATFPVTEDVIDTPDLETFSAYGITACYSFHGYTLTDVASVTLGGGITGQSMSFETTAGQSWSIVYWIAPVQTTNGTRYERVVLYLNDAPQGQVSIPSKVSGVQNLSGSLSALDPTERMLARNRTFLVAFGRKLVAEQPHESTTTAATAEAIR